MTREELNAKNKADLLALAQAGGLAATPAMTKTDLVELLLANAQMAAATPPAAIPAPAAPVATPDPAAAQMAAMQEQINQLLAANATQAADLAQARAATPVAVVPETLVPDNGEGLPKEGALRSLDGSLAGTRKVRVTVMATESEKEDVKVGVNGHLIQIKRGVPVIVDAAYVEVLKNATIDTFVEDDTGKRTPVQMQRYPFIAEPV